MPAIIPNRLSDFLRNNQNPYDKGLVMPVDAGPPAEVKDVDQKKGIVRMYLSAFGNVDSYRDIVVPGAFSKTIREWGPRGSSRIKHLVHHVPYWACGVFTDLEEDKHGLLATSQMLSHDRGRDTLIEYDEGHLTEHSIGFRLLKWEYDPDEDVLMLVEIQLYEGSAVAWGANPETPIVDIKSLRDDPAALDGLVSKVHSIQRCLKRDMTDEGAIRLEAELASYKTLVAQWEQALREELGLAPGQEPPPAEEKAEDTPESEEPLLRAETALQIAKSLNLQI